MVSNLKIFLVVTFILLNGTLLFAQTEIRQLFSRVLYFDQNSQIGQTPVQILETLPSNLFSWGLKNRAYYGGKFYQVYHANDGNSSNIYLRTSADGINWSGRILVSDDPGINSQFYAALAIGGNLQQPEICVIWNDDRDTNSQLRAAVSSDGGQTFSASVAISDHTDSDLILADIARDGNGNLYVAWNRLAGNSYYYTWFSRSSDSGLTWTPKMQVHFGRVFSYPTQIVARGAGEVLIGICDDQNNISNLITYTSADSGTTWQPQTPATNYGNNAGFRFFSMVKDANDMIHFVHPYIDNDELLEFRHNRSSDWGGSWSPLTAISDTSNPPIQPQLNQRNSPTLAVSPQGHIYAAWADKRLDPNGDNYEVYLTRSTDGGITWDSEIQINEMSQLEEQISPVIAVKSDGIIDTVSIVWTELRPNNLPPTSFNIYAPQNNSLLSQIDTIDFSWQEPLDPNGDPLTYILRLWENVAPEGSGAALPIERLILDTTITGITTTSFRFNGAGGLSLDNQYNWTALVSDGQATVASIDTFTFFTPAAMFSVNLLAPADGQVLTEDTVTFRWQPDIVAANGPLNYTFRLFGSSADTTVGSLSDTSLFFDGSPFFAGNQSYQWTVLANDGIVTVSSDTFSLSSPQSALSGLYTIGIGGDFPTFNAATTLLNAFGVSGPLTFQVLPGTYNEIFTVDNVPGQGAANPIVFESQSGVAADVNITYQQGINDNAMVVVDSTAYITFRGMTFTIQDSNYGRNTIFRVFSADNITIEECVLIGTDSPTASSSHRAVSAGSSHFLTVQRNTFQQGGNAVSVFGFADSTLAVGTQVRDNTIIDPRRNAIYLWGQDSPLVAGNTIRQAAGNAGIYLNYCFNDIDIRENHITHRAINSNHDLVALYLRDCDGGASRARLVNNMALVQAGDSTRFAVAMWVWQSSNLDVQYNTLHVSGFSSPYLGSGKAIHVLRQSGGIRLLNNILSAGRRGIGLHVEDSASIIESNYNAIYSADKYMAAWDNTFCRNLAALQANSGQDGNSVSAAPRYLSLGDLHSAAAALDGAATPLAGITTDIDGDPRDPQFPDIGADEFSPQNIGLAGNYIVGPTGTFHTPAEAIEALHIQTITAPVRLAVQPGSYHGSLHFRDIEGSSAANRVTMISQSGRAADVMLTSRQTTSDKQVLHINGAAYLTFRNLSISGVSTSSTYATVLVENGARGMHFIGNEIQVSGPLNGGRLFEARGSSTLAVDSLVIDANTFLNGQVRLVGYPFNPAAGLRFENNRMINDGVGIRALDVDFMNAPLITKNRIQVSNISDSGSSAVRVARCIDGLQFLGNRIQVTGSRDQIALFMLSCGGSPRALVANNFIAISGDSSQTALFANVSEIDFYHNSLHVSGGSAQQPINGGRVLWTNGSGGNLYNIFNNVLANSAGGYALYNLPQNTISDYNDLYTTGPVLALFHGFQYNDLVALQVGTGQEQNSISADPLFIDNFDLHLQNRSPLNDIATPLSAVTTDIDGQQRSNTTPDIGADEFTLTRSIVIRKNRLRLPIPLNPPLKNILNVQLFPGDVFSGYVLSDVNVLIDTVSHNNAADLDLLLLHKGITDTLAIGLNTIGSNFLNTIFDDSASQSISQGTPPYSGSFRPYGSLANFNGIDPEGDWELQIYNRGSDSTGVLDAWGLELEFELPSGIDEEPTKQLPLAFHLAQNYPNPFNPTTTILYDLPKATRVSLKVYNVVGQEVRTLVNERQPAGQNKVIWDGRNQHGQKVSSGVYVYRIQAGDHAQSRKMLLIQ